MSAWSLLKKPKQQMETTTAAFKKRQLPMMFIVFLKYR